MTPDPESDPVPSSTHLHGSVGENKPPQRISFITLLFTTAAVLLIATTIFDHRIALIGNHAQQQMARELLALQQLEDFISALKDIETGQRGYLLTGEDPYLQPYTNMRAQVHTRLEGLKRLAASGELPGDQVARVASLTQEKLSELEQTIQLRREKGFDAALGVVRSDRGKQLMDQIRSEVTSMRAGEEKNFAEAAHRSDWAAALRTGTFIALIVVNLAFLAWAFRKIGREVRRREAVALEVTRQKELLSTTLTSIGDAVIASDTEGRVSFLNPEAESLTGWKSSEAANRPLSEIFNIVNERTRRPAENPVEKVLRLGAVVGLANHTLLIARNGRDVPIDDSAAPIRDPNGPLHGVVLVFRDVTQHREAQKTTAHLAAIVEFSGDAVLTKNLDGIIQSWNASAQRLFGYGADEIIGKHITTLFPQDRLSEEDHIIGRLREGRPVERFETVRVAKGGRQIPVLVSISPLKDPDGNIIGASKVVHDITELVAAREALVREKELLSTTLASIGDAVILTDQQGQVTFLNTEAERLTGWTSSEAAGQPLPQIFRIINEHTRQGVENPVEKVLRVGTVVGLANHTILISRNGAEIPIDDSAAPIRQKDGPLFGVVLVFRDFTERKEMEARLQALALLPAQNPAPILRIDNDGLLLHANPTATRILPTLGIGQPSPEPLRTFAAEALQTGASVQRELAADGCTYLMTVVPVPGVNYANFYGTDVTERRKAEEALRLAHAQLADRAVHLETIVKERTAKLQEMVGELQHVSYAIVHDMRAPLRAMNAFAQALNDDLSAVASPSPELLDYCRRIIVAADRLDKLIQDSLNYTKSVLQEVQLKPVDLSKLVRGLIETYPNLQPERAEITIEGTLPLVLGEESLLTQCFSNLLDNAVKFVPRGVRPQIRVRTEPARTPQHSKTPTPNHSAPPDFVRITIEDNGIGIPQPAQPRLFGMFQRLTTDYEGTGIGLAIVRKVTERMGGRVGADSEPGKGSRFWVELRTPNSATHSQSNSST